DAEGVPIVALTPYTTSINSVDAASWQQGINEFRACLEAAHTVGATRVRVYAGSWHSGDTDHVRHWEQLRSALTVLAPEAPGPAVVLCIEHLSRTITHTPADTARLVSEVGPPS